MATNAATHDLPDPVDVLVSDRAVTTTPEPDGLASWCAVGALEGLPRKEVIQPQLPLRLPCYDFTPVTSPTFDGSLPKG